MKKTGVIIFAITLITGIAVSGCSLISGINGIEGSGNVKKETRNVADFKQINVAGNFTVEAVAQKDFSLEIETDDNLIQYIKTEVSDGVLKIDTTKHLQPKDKILVRVSAPSIESFKTSGASNVDLKNIKNDSLKVDSSGASKFKIEGTAKNFVIETSGASKVDAENLKTENTSIDASGASKIDVFATNDLNIKLSGAGKVYYSGSPKNISKDVSGAGKIEEK